ncbi:DUF4387 family protein [Oceanomicrobium pacificus]|uniref:DUF4387 family protein n=1 Tax=Oceanomicrobium pacificus TaxID=2692916 RepID=A0A6B0TPT7_9RHOB|nr:DUF4387 family protein [Oceanomicrobium pacificus]MXU66637.1 DUF4387 family protein [Oceanomicrobium pacificus]
MTRIGALVSKVRSKNAGPFWVTIDIFCASPDQFEALSAALDTRAVATRFGTDPSAIKRFDLSDLSVIKISLPRPVVQGSLGDRDMHGAQWAHLLAEMEVDL